MPHEPSRIDPPIQQAADWRCPSCGAVKPLGDFPAGIGAPTSCCAAYRGRRAAIAHRHRQRTLRQVARRVEASYHALLTQQARQGGDGDAP
jgi:hypothetical protein